MKALRLFLFSVLLIPFAAQAQQSLDVAVNGVGLSIGDSEEITGLRLNFRDYHMRRVTGINATIWMPYNERGGDVKGLALGLPLTGADNIEGIGYGILGVGANKSIKGIAFGGLGAGAGQDVHGIAFGGLGVGAGQDLVGITAGGLGAGAGRDFTGISMSGIGTGAGGTLKGLHMAGIGVGGTTVRGIVLSGFAAGGHDVKALMVAPAYINIKDDGIQRGLAISAFNRIQGEQAGFTIGIVNWARTLSGVQIGLLNFAGNKERMKWMPLVNWAHN
jgi:hypothetical protein